MFLRRRAAKVLNNLPLHYNSLPILWAFWLHKSVSTPLQAGVWRTRQSDAQSNISADKVLLYFTFKIGSKIDQKINPVPVTTVIARTNLKQTILEQHLRVNHTSMNNSGLEIILYQCSCCLLKLWLSLHHNKRVYFYKYHQHFIISHYNNSK